MFEFDLNLLSLATLGLAAILAIVAGASDARSFRIPNWVSVGLLALFPFYVIAQTTPVPWLTNLGIAFGVLAFGFFLYAKKLAGAGDAKFLAAVSLWAGPQYILLFLFITAIAGGLLSLAVLGLAHWKAYRGKTKGDEQAALHPFTKIHIPYGIAIAIGGLCLFLYLSHLG